MAAGYAQATSLQGQSEAKTERGIERRRGAPTNRRRCPRGNSGAGIVKLLTLLPHP